MFTRDSREIRKKENRRKKQQRKDKENKEAEDSEENKMADAKVDDKEKEEKILRALQIQVVASLSSHSRVGKINTFPQSSFIYL